jgi:DNA-binding NarL/FixJ family response regulator
MINIFVIDDHPVFIEGIKTLFSDRKDKIKVSGVALNAKEAMSKLKRIRVKVVLLDLIMPEISGVELCLYIKNEYPDIKVIILTGELNPVLLHSAWINKADAILIKHCGKEELVETIHTVLAGSRILGNEVPDFDELLMEKGLRKSKLTKREHLILGYLAKGDSREEVAQKLKSNKRAVNFHCHNMFKKFNTTKLIKLIEIAREEGLIV